MNLGLTTEQQLLVDSVRAFVAAELTPHEDAVERSDEVPPALIRQIRDAPQTLQNVVTYDAVIDVANPDLKLRPGMTANITFIAAEKDNVLRVPNAAMRFRPTPEIPPPFGDEPYADHQAGRRSVREVSAYSTVYPEFAWEAVRRLRRLRRSIRHRWKMAFDRIPR